VSALRSKRGLRPVGQVAEPSVVGLMEWIFSAIILAD
jgi:hypothetical protein